MQCSTKSIAKEGKMTQTTLPERRQRHFAQTNTRAAQSSRSTLSHLLRHKGVVKHKFRAPESSGALLTAHCTARRQSFLRRALI
eukprot:487933-Amphidinium_carterae.2